MPLAREADVEEGNPGVNGHARKLLKGKNPDEDDEQQQQHGCTPLSCARKGWIWAIIVSAVLLGTIIPIGIKSRRQPVTGIPDYTPRTDRKLNTTIVFDPMAGLNGTEVLSCSALTPDLPTTNFSESSPPPAVKLLGDRLVTAEGGKDVDIHGINWFGFNNGKTMVDGLDGENATMATWEGGDFATIVHQLKLLGFNAVRLPFLFGNLYTLPAQDYSKPCPQKQPTAESLAQRTMSPSAPKPSTPAPALSKNINPPGSTAGRCNAYLPNGPSTMARFLWVVQYFVANGFYVLLDYHPEPGNSEPVTDSVGVYSNNWLMLWAGLTCLPNYEEELRGRVFLDLMNEPDGVKITWDNAQGTRGNLGDYYLSVMEAIERQSGGKGPIYFIQGSGQEKAGSNWGDGFVTDPAVLKERNLSDPNAFFSALVQKPYSNRVVLSPHLYGPSLSNNTYAIGAPQWEMYSNSWGTLQKNGYCAESSNSSNSTAACQKFPAIIGETGSNFTSHAKDKEYFANLVKYMRMTSPADTYPTTKFDRWFWWAYNHNTKEVGGLVGADWKTLDWKKLDWMQNNLGLTPWYKMGSAAASPAAPAAAAAAPAAVPK